MRIEIFQPKYIYELGQRANQEDALWPQQTTTDDRLFIVCDGMGGHEKGEVASQTVSQAIGLWFREHVTPNEPFTDDQLREAIAYAYNELDKKDDDNAKKMGTTLTLLYIHAQGVTAAHIGDSRIYHIRPQEGTVLYQSRDHSLVFDLFQAGEITYEEMATYPQKNIITRAMQPGEENRTRPEIIHITDIQPGDYFYLCSDGMLEQMSNDELVSILTSTTSDDVKRQQLIAATTENSDNHTAWLIHIKDVVREEGDDKLVNEEPTARCNAINIINAAIESTPEVEVIEDEDDVEIDSIPTPSPAPPKGKKSYVSMCIAALCFVIIIIGAWALFFRNKGDVKLQRPKPMYIHRTPPIRQEKTKDSETTKHHSQKKDTITKVKDTTKNNRYEPTRHQQSGNAPGWDNLTRNLQNR